MTVQQEAARVGVRRKRVVIVYKTLPQYRRRFFELLRESLDAMGIDLVLAYGQATGADAAKGDTVRLAWATPVHNTTLNAFGARVIWQPVLSLCRGADLVIVEQASKLVVNYVLQVWSRIGGPKFAFWGHGKNFQELTANPVGERIKRAVSRHAHWWFAYNEMSAAVVRSFPFPSERVTLVQNAIDTRELQRVHGTIDATARARLRDALGLRGKHVAIYAGGMYFEKRLPFLIDAAREIRQRLPDFELILIGAGTDAHLAQSAAEEHEWIKYVGPKFDADKVAYFSLAELFLLPGLVGLAVLDSFALETPLVTTALDFHSPEIEYLVDGENGVIVHDAADPIAYAEAVVALFNDPQRMEHLREGCRTARNRYTVEEMVARFTEGVVSALGRV